MKNSLLGIGFIVALGMGIFLGLQIQPHGSPQPTENDSKEETLWTCSMHPQIQLPENSGCPICGMDLIPLSSDGAGGAGAAALVLSEHSAALAEIETVDVVRAFPEARVSMVGTLAVAEASESSLTARFPARIDQLYVNYTGIPVKEGDHLAEVYSPELLSAQQELLTAHRRDPESAFYRAAYEKLVQWELQPDQILAILERGEPWDHVDLRAPIGGVVMSKNVNEGDYIQTGEPLFEIADLSQLWLHLEAFEADIAKLHFAQEVTFTVDAYPGEHFAGQISFIDPRINSDTRTVAVRVIVPNPQSRLKPGMFARGEISVKLAGDGQVFSPDLAGKWISPMHPEIVKDTPGDCDICGMALVPAEDLGYVGLEQYEAPLLVPNTAVLRTGKRAIVYVEQASSEAPAYDGREIVLGPRAGDQFIVISGLEEGEKVVTRGAFKIDSALQIQAQPSMMSMDLTGPEPSDEPRSLPEPMELSQAALDQYLKLQVALAADDFAAAEASVKGLVTAIGHQGPLHETLHALLDAESLDGMRRPHFETLSKVIIASLKQGSLTSDEPLYVMHCPMVYGATGADWIQATDTLKNPYFGAAMLMCGELKESLPE